MGAFDDLVPGGGTSPSANVFGDLTATAPKPGPLRQGFGAGVAGLKSGAYGFGALVEHGVAAGYKALGAPGPAEEATQLEQSLATQQAEQKQLASPPGAPDWSTTDFTSPSSVASTAGYQLATFAPTLAMMATGAGIGGAVAKEVLGTALESAPALLTAAKNIGALTSLTPTSVGEEYSRAKEAGAENPELSAVTGGVGSVLPYLLPLGAIEKFGAKTGEGILLGAAKGAAVGAPVMAVQGAASTAIERAAAGQPVTGPEAEAEYKAGLPSSLFLGGVGGAVAGVHRGMTPAEAAPAETPPAELPPAETPPAEAPPAAPTKPPASAADLLSYATARLDELERKAKGGPEQQVTGEDGTPQTIPAVQPEYLTEAEKAERAFLTQSGSDAAAVAGQYGLRLEEPPTPEATHADLAGQHATATQQVADLTPALAQTQQAHDDLIARRDALTAEAKLPLGERRTKSDILTEKKAVAAQLKDAKAKLEEVGGQLNSAKKSVETLTPQVEAAKQALTTEALPTEVTPAMHEQLSLRGFEPEHIAQLAPEQAAEAIRTTPTVEEAVARARVAAGEAPATPTVDPAVAAQKTTEIRGLLDQTKKLGVDPKLTDADIHQLILDKGVDAADKTIKSLNDIIAGRTGPKLPKDYAQRVAAQLGERAKEAATPPSTLQQLHDHIDATIGAKKLSDEKKTQYASDVKSAIEAITSEARTTPENYRSTFIKDEVAKRVGLRMNAEIKSDIVEHIEQASKEAAPAGLAQKAVFMDTVDEEVINKKYPKLVRDVNDALRETGYRGVSVEIAEHLKASNKNVTASKKASGHTGIGKVAGGFDTNQNTIILSAKVLSKLSKADIVEFIAHEAEHAKQHAAGDSRPLLEREVDAYRVGREARANMPDTLKNSRAGLTQEEFDRLPPRSQAAASDAYGAAMANRGHAMLDRLAQLVGDRPDLDVKLFTAGPGDPIGSYARVNEYKSVISMALNAKSAPGVADHEGYHYAEDRLLTAAERRITANALTEGKPLFDQLVQKLRQYDRENQTDLVGEVTSNPAEARAYAFEFWRRGELDVTGHLARAWQKLQQFFEKVSNAVKGLGFKSADDVFTALDHGEMATRGATAGEGGAPRNSVARDRPWYRSALTEAVEAIPSKQASAQGWKEQIKGLIAKGAVKKDELDAVGLNDYLDLQQGKVSKEQVVSFLKENGVQVKDVTLGGASQAEWEKAATAVNRAIAEHLPEAEIDQLRNVRDDLRDKLDNPDETKFSGYQLPGGENYKELLLTLPQRARDTTGWTARKVRDVSPVTGKPEYEVHDAAGKWLSTERNQNSPDAAIANAAHVVAGLHDSFRSSHFDQPNILAHVRFNERTDAEGRKVLFLEELQSDWAQKGRKGGFFDASKPWEVFDPKDGNAVARFATEQAAKEEAARRGASFDYERGDRGRSSDAVPSAPFVGKTEAWVALALKRMIRYAAENGFDRVAWTTGEQQAARYDLSKQVESISYQKNSDGTFHVTAMPIDGRGQVNLGERATAAQLEDKVGKEVAKKIVDGEGKPTGGGLNTLSGVDLKVGGEGMKGFYDKIVPGVANDVLKKLGGGKVGEVGIPKVNETGHPFVTFDRGVESPVALHQPGFDITPQMAEAAANGLPLFSQAAKEAEEFNRSPVDAGKVVDRTTSFLAQAADRIGTGNAWTRLNTEAFRHLAQWKTVQYLNHQADVHPELKQAGVADGLREYREAHTRETTAGTYAMEAPNRVIAAAQKVFRTLGDEVKVRALNRDMQEIGVGSSMNGTDFMRSGAANRIADQTLTPRQVQRAEAFHQQYLALQRSHPDAAQTLLTGALAHRQQLVFDVAHIARELLNKTTDPAAQLVKAQHATGLDMMAKDVREARNGDTTRFYDGASFTLDRRLQAAFKATAGLQKDSLLREQMNELRDLYYQQVRSPYFSAGRQGDYFANVGFKEMDDATWARMNAAIQSHGIILGDHQGQDHIFVRTETPEEAAALRRKLTDAAGNKVDLEQNANGPLAQAPQISNVKGISKAMRSILDTIQEALPNNAEAQNVRDALMRKVMSMIPETASRSAAQLRRNVPGYDADFLGAFGRRAQGGAQDTARIYAAPLFTQAFKTMDQSMVNLNKSGSEDAKARGGIISDELRTRYNNLMKPSDNSTVNTLNSISHAFYLGGATAFYIRTMAQPFHRGLPILGSRYGFYDSAKEILHGQADALKVIAASVKQAVGENGIKGALDADFRFKDMGFTPKEEAFLQELHDRGILKLGQARQMADLALTGVQHGQDAIRALSMTAGYAEMTNRLATGIAAFRLAEKGKAGLSQQGTKANTEYAVKTIVNAMDDFDQYNTARAIGRNGVAGKVTPLLTQFMNYSLQTMQQIARTVQDGVFNKDQSPEGLQRSAEAKKEFAGLMATTAMISGGLGLPFANAIAGVYNQLTKDEDDPSDIRLAARNALADALGTKGGEIAAHGLGGVLGVDTASFGLQNLLPGSEFLASRRLMKERLAEGSEQLMGPALNGASDLFKGFSMMSDGYYVKGIEQMLPSALKGYWKAGELATRGYTDNKGNRIALAPTGWDIGVQALGLRPQDKAEQAEAANYFGTDQYLLQHRKAVLEDQVYKAVTQGTAEDQQAAFAAATKFSRQNPLDAIRDWRGVFRAHALSLATAASSETGVGVSSPRLYPKLGTKLRAFDTATQP